MGKPSEVGELGELGELVLPAVAVIGGGGFSVGGIGISFPIGGATAAQSLAASSALTALAQGTLVWSGSASTPASATRSRRWMR